jgi:hypothetical protein
MERTIETAWRAFWLGLGAACVLIAHSVLAPSVAASAGPSMTNADLVAPDEARAPEAPVMPLAKKTLRGYHDPS